MRSFMKFSQVLNSVIGKLSDGASSTGAVLARLAYIIGTVQTNILNDIKKYGMKTTIATATFIEPTPGTTWQTVLDVSSGSGYLYRACAVLLSTSTTYGNVNVGLRITIDGTLYPILPLAANNAAALIGSKSFSGTPGLYNTTAGADILGPIKYNSSLKIEVNSTYAGYPLHAFAQYGIDV